MLRIRWPGAAGALIIGAAAFAGDAVNLPGWPVNIGSCHNTASVAVDVNDDNRAEVAAVNWEGRLYLLNAQGRNLPGFPLTLGSRCGTNGAPALADVDGDGAVDIVIATADGRLLVYDRQGQPLPGWPQSLAPDARGAAIQDFTSYRGLEIFAAAGNKVFAYHADGVPVRAWPVELNDIAAGTPAVGDLDGNRTPEVVAAAGNQVYVFGTGGQPLPGWPVRLEGNAAVPIIADVNGDGRAEVIIGTAAGSAYVFKYDGTLMAGWPQAISSKPITTPAAVGDLGDNGALTIVFIAGSTGITGATVAALDAGGRPRPGFPKQLTQPVVTAPLIVDADGDGAAEILITTYDGSLIAFDRNGALAPGYPLRISGSGVTATPAAADLDNDGLLDVVVARQNGTLEAVATGAAFETSANPWPMWGGDPWHTGKFFGSGVARRDFTLTARRGEVAIRWQADPRRDRRGWAIIKARRESAGGTLNYEEIAYIEEQASATYTYRDAQVEDGVVYYYKIEERLASGASITNGPKTVRAVGAAPAAASIITRCYPNPFTTQVNISYQIAPGTDDAGSTAVVSVYDISGKLVKTLLSESKSPGEYLTDWDGTDTRGTPVASGVYLVSLRTGRLTPPATKTVVLVR